MEMIDVKALREFKMKNLYATGQSYISALEDETKYPSINGVENVMSFLKTIMKGFKNERTGTFHRWEYFNIHFCRNAYEILIDNEVNNFKDLFKSSNSIEISEVCGKHFEIKVTRKPNETFEVVIKTYAYIGINESAIQYLDEEQAKIMIARKLYTLKKNK